MWYKDVYNKTIDWFRQQPQGFLGIRENAGAVQVVYTEYSSAGALNIIWQDTFEQSTAENQENFLEAVGIRLKQNTGEDILCCLALDGQDIFYYEKEFTGLSGKEIAEAAKLDFAAAVSWDEKYYCAYEYIGDSRIRIGGITKSNLDSKIRCWREFFPRVEAVLVCAEAMDDMSLTGDENLSGEFRLAAYAVWSVAGNEGISFSSCPKFMYKWNWLHGAASIWIATLGAFACFTMGWCYMDYDLGEQIKQQAQEVRLMGDIAERKKAIDADKSVIERKNKVMEGLQKNNLLGQGLLINIGKSMKEGIWLTGLSAQAGQKIILQGKAAGYSQVSSLINDLQSDEAFFQGKIFLASADADADGLINFQMNGKL